MILCVMQITNSKSRMFIGDASMTIIWDRVSGPVRHKPGREAGCTTTLKLEISDLERGRGIILSICTASYAQLICIFAFADVGC